VFDFQDMVPARGDLVQRMTACFWRGKFFSNKEYFYEWQIRGFTGQI
jgi:hypothetical protein